MSNVDFRKFLKEQENYLERKEIRSQILEHIQIREETKEVRKGPEIDGLSKQIV